MRRRKLGTTGIQVGEIGFGTEHLPPDAGTIREIIEVAIEGGVNFIDVLQIDPAGDGAYVWDGLGPLIRERRDRFVLACHWGIGYRFGLDDCKRTFPVALRAVGNDVIDVAMMTMVGEPGRTGDWLDLSLRELETYKRDGHVRAIAASVHDVDVATGLARSGSVDALMYYVNMTQYDDARQQTLYEACREKGVGLIAMKPYSAGLLLRVNGEPTSITPLQCLDYVLSQPVTTVVPGIKNAQELHGALAYYDVADDKRDHRPALERVRRELAGHCVYCRACMPCPAGIDITSILSIVNWARGGVQDWLRGMYDGQAVKPSACSECEACTDACGFDVDVMGTMRKAVDLFES